MVRRGAIRDALCGPRGAARFFEMRGARRRTDTWTRLLCHFVRRLPSWSVSLGVVLADRRCASSS
eukprot:8844168-Pyramimonas_sp.AAC.1